MSKATSKKNPTPAVIVISRSEPPYAEVAQKIDRICAKTGDNVSSIGFKAVCAGIDEVERIMDSISNGKAKAA